MATSMESSMIEEGVEAVFKKLGPGRAIKFFQSMVIERGDSVNEIESMTERMTKEQVIKMLKSAKIN
ncbi:hypothetical protein HYS31_05570 [Candidatus Woesearchaeota archaeon]|nr:hypothetical protein [Candidatus Woesearchaeota archaeon]